MGGMIWGYKDLSDKARLRVLSGGRHRLPARPRRAIHGSVLSEDARGMAFSCIRLQRPRARLAVKALSGRGRV